MNPVTQFESRVSRLRQLILIEKIRRMGIFALFLSLLLSAIAMTIHKAALFRWEGYSLYPLLLLLSLALSGLRVYKDSRTLKAELIEIDRRLRLKDRLGTAFEYCGSGRNSSMSDLLMSDAADYLGSISRDKIFPRAFSPLHILVPLSALLFLLILFVDISPGDRKEDPFFKDSLREIGVMMEHFSRQRPEDMPGQGPQREIYEEMEKLAAELRKDRPREQEFLNSLGKLRESVASENDRLSDQLRRDLIIGDPSNLPILKPLLKERPEPEEIGEMMNELKDLFDGELTPSLTEDLEQLERNLKMERFLEDIMVRTGLETWGKEDSPTPDSFPGLSRERANKEVKDSDRPPLPREERSSFSAGNEKAEGRRKEAQDLERAKGPIIRDEGQSAPGEQYNHHIRSLPVTGRAEMKAEDLYRQYEQALETALLKESIPPEQREIIKNYFLSIGLGRERHEDENNP